MQGRCELQADRSHHGAHEAWHSLAWVAMQFTAAFWGLAPEGVLAGPFTVWRAELVWLICAWRCKAAVNCKLTGLTMEHTRSGTVWPGWPCSSQRRAGGSRQKVCLLGHSLYGGLSWCG